MTPEQRKQLEEIAGRYDDPISVMAFAQNVWEMATKASEVDRITRGEALHHLEGLQHGLDRYEEVGKEKMAIRKINPALGRAIAALKNQSYIFTTWDFRLRTTPAPASKENE